MADSAGGGSLRPTDETAELFAQQSQAAVALFRQLMPGGGEALADPGDAAHWADVMARMQAMWLEFQAEKLLRPGTPSPYVDPAYWLGIAERWYRQMPLTDPKVQQGLWEEGLNLWQGVLGQFGIGPRAAEAREGALQLPRSDRRFKDPKWRDQPLFALIHQTYLMVAEQLTAMAEGMEGLDPARKAQLGFVTRALLDALSPANFPLTNPLALERAIETKGESLVKGLEHLIADLRRGQLTQTDPDAFRLGETIAATPGKVVHETPLYQLIQYSPTTERVLETPLVIFPAWINRFYILDLSPEKSFVRWAVEQGITVFMVSWKSADKDMSDVLWDDYVAAQIDAIDVVRKRLDVPSVHTIGYCVAGTTLAATLAVLARKGKANKVKSATFFVAQVDFEQPGDLGLFVDDRNIETIGQLSPEGFFDGRYMAMTFNLLRGNELIWDYVARNYLMGEDYRPFDLLHWNGDVTNLPARWHQCYLRDLYRDNKMVVPDALSVNGTPLDLTRIETPVYIQAGREDHIAPAESVWKLMHHFRGSKTFALAGSGHIAGVVNPPAAGKYQHWTNDTPAETFAEFMAGAVERPGSWWPHWLAWLRAQAPDEVRAKGKRKPGGNGDAVIEDAPGRYVKMR